MSSAGDEDRDDAPLIEGGGRESDAADGGESEDAGAGVDVVEVTGRDGSVREEVRVALLPVDDGADIQNPVSATQILVEGEEGEEGDLSAPYQGAETSPRDFAETRSPSGTVRRRLQIQTDPAALADRRPDDGVEERRPLTLEERHEAVNSLFGFMPWKGHVAKRPLSERSENVRALYAKDVVKKKPGLHIPITSMGNFFWTASFGWWLALVYVFVSLLMFCTVVGSDYGFHCLQLARYIFFPFGKHLERVSAETFPDVGESRRLLESKRRHTEKRKSSVGRKVLRGLAGLIWYIVAVPILWCAHTISWIACWMSVFMIPMAKVNWESMKCLVKSPLQVAMRHGDPIIGGRIVLCTYNAVNRFYYKYSVGGMNVMLVNMVPFILGTIIWGYSVPSSVPIPLRAPPLLMFVMCLIAVIPLAYYIGAAISSISAQSTFAVGAILNATFGSIIELILYYLALRQGLSELVTSAVTGSILGTMLLLPGLAMIFGGFKFKEQRFNTSAAGVSSVLLIISIIGAFTPTVFYSAYGSYDLKCGNCDHVNATTSLLNCHDCHYTEVENYDEDPVYKKHARPLMYCCACILPIAYAVGLIFTLKTHSYMWDVKYWKKDDADEGGGGGHSGPEWSRLRCVLVLLLSTICFAAIAEKLVDSIEPTLELIGLQEGFVGLTIIALVPNTAEFVNACQFALRNNIALSVEIGSNAAIQICLIQIPVLVLMSVIINKLHSLHSFTLIFPTLDLFSVIFSVIILNYISIDGRSNYFEGAALVFIWLLLVLAFFWVP